MDGETVTLPVGTRVSFKQFAKAPGFTEPLPVWNGAVFALVEKGGELRFVHNGVDSAELPKRRCNLITADQAIKIAKEAHDSEDSEVLSTDVVLYGHEVKQGRVNKLLARPCELRRRRLDPTYAIVLSSSEPWSTKQYLVDGKSGRIVHENELLKYMSQVSPAQKAAQDPASKYFPVTPDPKVR